ncbi:MAG: hypothetical protein PHX70_12390 [Clostridium sp.]|nr:hypothetical protein [Clostridium sp.]
MKIEVNIHNVKEHNKLKNIFNIAYLILFILCLCEAFIYGYSFKIMNDGFWHIKVGEYIIKNLSIPYTDIFSWYGKSMHLAWISHEWLFGIIAYIVYSIHGFLSVAFFVGTCSFLTALLIYIYSKMRSNNKWISLMCMSFYIAMLNSDIGLAFRPITVSAVLILAMCIVLEKKHYLWALAILIIGINMHGGIYPVYIILFAYYTLFKNYKYFIVSLMCILINPYTYNIYLYTINAFKEMTLLKDYINEWKVTPIYSYKISLSIIVLVIFIYVLGKVKIKDVVFSASFIMLAISSQRQIIFLGLTVLPILSPYILNMLTNASNKLCENRDILNAIKIVFKKHIRLSVLCCIFIVMEALLVIPSLQYGYEFFKDKAPIFQVDNSNYPIYAADYINKHPEIKYSHLLSHYNDSPYLIFRGIPSFVDSRADLFTPTYNKNVNVFYDFMHAFVDLDNPQEVIEKYKINYILINKSYSVYEILCGYNNLTVVYDDGNYCIFKVNN